MAATSPSGARGSATSPWCSAAQRRRSRSLVHAQRGRYRCAQAAAARGGCRRGSDVRVRRQPRRHGASKASARRSWRRSRRGSIAASNRWCSSTGADSRSRSSARRAAGRPVARGAARDSSCTAKRRTCAVIIAAIVERLRAGVSRVRQRRPRAARARHAAPRARARQPAFRDARIVRIDRDSTRRKDAFAGVRERVHAGDVDILVGTQMLAKGHDFPRLTLVGVLGADNALYSGDFRATERLAALLFQVSGRAGRADLPGEVIVQTDFPSHRARALARRPRLRKLRGNAARGTARGNAAAVRASRPAHWPKRRSAMPSMRSSRRRAMRAASLRARGFGARRGVSRRCPRALPRRAGLERGQVLAHATRAERDAALSSAMARRDRGAAGPARPLGARCRSARIRVMPSAGAPDGHAAIIRRPHERSAHPD